MEKPAVFKSNRLPKSLTLPENVTRVDVIALGRGRSCKRPILVTNNLGELSNVPGLQIEDWS